MKRFFISIICTLITTFSLIAQTIPSSEQRQVINPIIDAGFSQWSSKSWKIDQYVSRSSKINSVKVDEDYGDLEVEGIFQYSRFGIKYDGTFYALIDKNGRLNKIRYSDRDGFKGSKTF